MTKPLDWQKMLDLCPAASCLTRLADGAVLALNDRCRAMIGYPASSQAQANGLVLELAESPAESTRLSERLWSESTLANLPARLLLAPGATPVEVRACLSAVLANGEPCALAFLQQMNDSMRTEQALAAARDAAIESARLKSEFLANISHEIRTPLNGIIGMTQLLRDTKLGSLQRSFTETIRTSADNLLHLINDLLDFSKLEAGKLEVDQAPFELLSTVENLLDLLAERAHSRGIELTYLVHSDVPTRLVGDVARLRQVLTNLVGNAIKFTEQGEVSLEVRRETGDDGSPVLRFEVVDTGIGIPEDSLPRLFQMFEQVDNSTSRRYGGTGLGLAISRQLVEVMSGTIGAASTLGRGSRFWFRLPLNVPTGATGKAASEVPPRLHRLRLLLLESNATSARHLLHVLGHLQIDCVHVTRGQDALAALREAARESRPIQIAFIDHDTPGMDGLTLARAIKVDPAIAETRIVVLTTLNQNVETSLLHAAQVGACLTKPLKQSRIVDYLLAALTEHGLPRPSVTRAAEDSTAFPQFGSIHANAPIRILVAEDNPISQKVARGLLARFGYASEVVDTGRKLLRAVELAPFDIIFVDCQLPELDGLLATRELRRREACDPKVRRTHVIAMTADAGPGARERCLEAGMDDYLSKPVRLDELHAALRRAVEFVNLAASRQEQRVVTGWIDPAVMDTLRMLRQPGHPDPLPPLINEFIETAENRVDEIQSSIVSHDPAILEHAAHSLRGSAGGIGALRLAALAAELEEDARQTSLHRAAELLSQIETEFASVRRALEFERER